MTSKFVCSYSLLSQTQDAHSLQFTELKYTGVSNIPLSQGKVLPQNICGVSENYYIKLNIRNQLIIFWSIKQPQDGFFFFFFLTSKLQAVRLRELEETYQMSTTDCQDIKVGKLRCVLVQTH